MYLAKRDVAAAFKLIYVCPDDVGGMATELDGAALRRAYTGPRRTLLRGARKVANMLALYLVLVFGFLGSPGEWVVWSWALKEAHARAKPEKPLWNGEECFDSSYLVDDQALLEPGVARRSFFREPGQLRRAATTVEGKEKSEKLRRDPETRSCCAP